MREGLNSVDLDTLRRQAHAIKGGAANLCALPISAAAAEVEAAARRNDKAAGAAGIDMLEGRLIALRKFMEQLHLKDRIHLLGRSYLLLNHLAPVFLNPKCNNTLHRTSLVELLDFSFHNKIH